ncbi:MAG: hypothetical protein ACTSWN_06385 [Promethearchaeota archaeon]
MDSETSELESKHEKWQKSLAELYTPPFARKWATVGPKHPLWNQRIKLEIHLIGKYIQFLKSENAKQWFYIRPDPNPKYKSMLWRGYIQIPSRPHLKFDMVILLSGEYPKVTPRAFVEESLISLAGSKIYVENRFPPKKLPNGEWAKDPVTKKSYVMICHDHMARLENAWAPNLGIVHFFIREVWFWFAAMQKFIIEEDDRRRASGEELMGSKTDFSFLK